MARPKRVSLHSYIGVQRYFLTICTLNRAEHFRSDETVAAVADQFLRVGRAQRVAIVVYLVMPDHLHALVDGEDDGADLTRFVKLAKQQTGFEFKQKTKRKLWQEGYYERVLRSEEATVDVVRYILENPIRKKLVANVEHYPFWGSSLYTREALLEFIRCRV
jgi:putative transposase